MTAKRFYQASLTLPIVVPLALAGSGLARGKSFLLMSVLYGGIPYVFAALWALSWIDFEDETRTLWLVVRAPFVVLGFFALLAVPFGLVLRWSPQILGGMLLFAAFYSIILGYCYVGLVLITRAVAAWMGWIK
jgi:hypothetical protein